MALLLPLLYFLLSMFFGLVALNVRQRYRFFLLLLLIGFALLAFHRVLDVSSHLEHAHTLGLFVLIYISHMICVLCIEKYHLPGATVAWKWRAAYKMMFNARWLGTDRQSPNVRVRAQSMFSGTSRDTRVRAPLEYPTTLSEKDKDVPRQQERRAFLRNRLFSMLTMCALHRLHWQFFLAPHPHYFQPLEYADFSPPKQTYFRRLHTVTARETLIRSSLVITFVSLAYTTYTGLHDALALIFVGFGIDDPKDWPPLYGSPRQMYTLRRFWGKYWHRLVYRSYTAYGSVVSERLLRLRRDSLVGRLVVNFVVFFLSGIIHALVTWQLGLRCGYWEDIAWFCCNFAGILLEEGVQWVVFRLLCGHRWWNGATSKGVGFLWVFMFFFWSLPKSEYPKMSCQVVA